MQMSPAHFLGSNLTVYRDRMLCGATTVGSGAVHPAMQMIDRIDDFQCLRSFTVLKLILLQKERVIRYASSTFLYSTSESYVVEGLPSKV